MGDAHLHPILKFSHNGAIRDEVEKLALCSVWQRNDEQSEDTHLQHQKHKYLREVLVSKQLECVQATRAINRSVD